MQSMGAGMGMTAAGSTKDIEWKVPEGWQTKPPSSMRVGSFLAKASNGLAVDISVVPLSGEAGGGFADINHWRGESKLFSISLAELPHHRHKNTPAGEG